MNNTYLSTVLRSAFPGHFNSCMTSCREKLEGWKELCLQNWIKDVEVSIVSMDEYAFSSSQ